MAEGGDVEGSIVCIATSSGRKDDGPRTDDVPPVLSTWIEVEREINTMNEALNGRSWRPHGRRGVVLELTGMDGTTTAADTSSAAGVGVNQFAQPLDTDVAP